MPYHGVSLSGINASRFKDYVIPPIKWLGSNVPDGSTDISAVSTNGITQKFNQPVNRLSKSDAKRLGIATPTLIVTATPKGGGAQTLVKDVDFIQTGGNNNDNLYLRNDLKLSTYSPYNETVFIPKFGFEGLTVSNIRQYFREGSDSSIVVQFYANVVKPDTTYTITYSPNYFWNKSTGMFYDQEISITFTTRPVQATATLTFKKDMAQELADSQKMGIATIVNGRNSSDMWLYFDTKYLQNKRSYQLAQRRTDTTSELYDYTVDKCTKYTVIDLSKWDNTEYANWYTGMTEELKSGTAVIAGTTYAASHHIDAAIAYHYYDIHLEVW